MKFGADEDQYGKSLLLKLHDLVLRGTVVKY